MCIRDRHDASYKQESSPRYHGRDLAVLRAHKGGGEAVRLISMPGDAEEAEFIITDIENVRRPVSYTHLDVYKRQV